MSFESRITATQKNIADSQLSKMKEDMLTNDNYVFSAKVARTSLSLTLNFQPN